AVSLVKGPPAMELAWKLSVTGLLALSGMALGQVKPAGGGAPVAGGSAASPEAALEDKVMGSLAAREMDGLLEYYFKKHNVPAEKQAAVKSIVAWRELSNPKLPGSRRRTLLQDGIRGIKTFLDSTRDTEALMNRAAQLI